MDEEDEDAYEGDGETDEEDEDAYEGDGEAPLADAPAAIADERAPPGPAAEGEAPASAIIVIEDDPVKAEILDLEETPSLPGMAFPVEAPPAKAPLPGLALPVEAPPAEVPPPLPSQPPSPASMKAGSECPSGLM